ncbi:dienelactone hydrolase family protein [Streptomyces broussonetiae]|uniref:dienelactone hydrolase family protein n=1 Tax=Streptomyces broussonetiae TaxID=2686304 RepID=UPI00406BC7EB
MRAGEPVADPVLGGLAAGPRLRGRCAPRPAGSLLGKALTAAGVRHRAEVCAGAHHGFTQAGTAMDSAEATERHWTALPDLFGRRPGRTSDA